MSKSHVASAKYLIHRRPFNPTEGQKDIRVIVARFSRHADIEAQFCRDMLQNQATKFDDKSGLSKYRYTLYTVPDGVDKTKFAALQIDDSKARKTGRPFKYELTWDIKHDRCHMIAYHKRYGSIRAEVDNTVEARQWFVRAIKRVWRNASMSTL